MSWPFFVVSKVIIYLSRMQYVLLLAADMCVIVGWLMCVASSEEMASYADNVQWEWGCVDIERGEY